MPEGEFLCREGGTYRGVAACEPRWRWRHEVSFRIDGLLGGGAADPAAGEEACLWL